MPFKLNISDKEGKSWKLETEAEALSGKRVGDKVEGKDIGADFEGYDLETWILFNFYGNSPSSITLDLPFGASTGKPQKPQLIMDPNKPLPIIDYNWNGNLQRLTIWLKSNISNEYILGLQWSFTGNNVTMTQLKIADTQVLDYFVVYYLEKGVNCNHLPQIDNISQMFSILEFTLNSSSNSK